jgi:hypothetical protein
MKSTTHQTRLRQEFFGAGKKAVNACMNPRGDTITGFSMREAAAFHGFAISTVNNYIKWYNLPTIKLAKGTGLEMQGNDGRVRRVLTMEAFFTLNRLRGTHRNLRKHISKCDSLTMPVREFYANRCESDRDSKK